jgi:hypothetical protein
MKDNGLSGNPLLGKSKALASSDRRAFTIAVYSGGMPESNRLAPGYGLKKTFVFY